MEHVSTFRYEGKKDIMFINDVEGNTLLYSFLMLMLLEQKDFQFTSVQSLSCVWLFVTPRATACEASLSITNSQSVLELMSIESVMLSNHLNPLSSPSLPDFSLS